jgi:hypothetical protein
MFLPIKRGEGALEEAGCLRKPPDKFETKVKSKIEGVRKSRT